MCDGTDALSGGPTVSLPLQALAPLSIRKHISVLLLRPAHRYRAVWSKLLAYCGKSRQRSQVEGLSGWHARPDVEAWALLERMVDSGLTFTCALASRMLRTIAIALRSSGMDDAHSNAVFLLIPVGLHAGAA